MRTFLQLDEVCASDLAQMRTTTGLHGESENLRESMLTSLATLANVTLTLGIFVSVMLL